MLLRELVEQLDLEVLTTSVSLEQDVSTGYTGDMLSDVMANAPENGVWITIQVHANIVAVATLRSLAAIIIACGRRPDAPTLAKAEEAEIAVLTSRRSAFDLAGRIYTFGVKAG